ncbi:MAG: flagellar hook-basal body complex protein, partial [Eubacteriales bacterium]|nr:flagellar hook-basal body complex protein [Eubacteriales bacterium]
SGEITGIKEGDPIIVKGVATGWLTEATVKNTSPYYGGITMTTTRSPEVKLLTTINGVDVPEDANINGELKVHYDSATDTYKLNYKKLGETIETVTEPGTVSADKIEFTVDSTTAGVPVIVTIPFGTNPDAVTIPSNGILSLGNVVAKTMDVSVSTYDKSGQVVELKLNDWPVTESDNKFTLGDFAFTVDAKVFGSLSNQDNKVIGRVGPGAGAPEKIANLAVAKFANSDGLSQTGEGYYIETTNSGKAEATMPGNQGTGSFRAGALEMSNVDLSKEFTEMIITQRGFQANTRMITVSDEMLSELVNMKR